MGEGCRGAELGASGSGLERGNCKDPGDFSIIQGRQSPVGNTRFAPFFLLMVLHKSMSMMLGTVCLCPFQAHGVQLSGWENTDITVLRFWTTSTVTRFFLS